jgi:hypothetical protein
MPFDRSDERMDAYCQLADAAHICGCGVPDEALCRIRDILACIDRRRGVDVEAWKACDEELEHLVGGDIPGWLLWYWMEGYGWLEHGTGVKGSWLTGAGHDLLEMLNEWIEAGKPKEDWFGGKDSE